MSGSTGRIRVEFIGNTRSLSRSFDQAWAKANTFGKKMALVAEGLQSFGRNATMYVTLPLVAIGAASVKMAVDFEGSMSKIRSLVGASEQQMKEYEAAIMKMAPRVGKAPKELAEALYFVASAGFEGAAALRVLEASAKASMAGLGDTATVADAVTSAVNAYGEKALSAARSTDILLAAVREGKAEPEQFAAAIGRVIPAASQLGVGFDEVAAAMASMSLTGQSAEEAAVALNQVLMNSLKPTKEGAETLGKVGLSYEELRASLRDDGLLATLDLLDKGFNGNVESMARVFGNARSLRAVLALTGASAGKTTRIFDKLAHATGDTDEAARKMAEDSGVKLRQSLAQLQAVAIQVGQQLIPVVTQAAEEIGKVVAWFDRLSPETKKLAVRFGLLLAALGPVSYAMGTGIKAALGLAQAYKAVAKWGLLGAAAQAKFNAAGKGAGVAAAGRGAGAAGAAAAGGVAGTGLSTAAIGAIVAAVAASPFIVGAAVEATGLQRRSGQGDAGIITGGRTYGAGRGGERIAYLKEIEGQARAIDDVIANLGAKAATASGEQFDAIAERIRDIRRLVMSGFDFGDINAEHTDAQLRGIRDRIQNELGITRKAADRIMASMFKNWRPQDVVRPKVNQAGAAVERRWHQARKQLEKQIRMPAPDITAILNALGRVQSSAQNTQDLLNEKIQMRIHTRYTQSGSAKGGGSAYGSIQDGPRTGYWHLLHGKEAIIPLEADKASAAARVLDEAGLLGKGGGGDTFVNVFLDSEPVAARIEVRRAEEQTRRRRTLGLAPA